MSRSPGDVGPQTVLVVETDPLARQVIRETLDEEPDLSVVGEAADRTGVRELMRSWPDSVAVIDPYQPGIGVSVLHEIAETSRWRVLVFTAVQANLSADQAIASGPMAGYLLKDGGVQSLAAAVRAVAAGLVIVAVPLARKVFPGAYGGSHAERLRQLSKQELRVLKLLALGAGTSEIATMLHVSESTVKSHVSHVLAKLDVRDRTQAVVFAYQAGLVSAGGECGTLG